MPLNCDFLFLWILQLYLLVYVTCGNFTEVYYKSTYRMLRVTCDVDLTTMPK